MKSRFLAHAVFAAALVLGACEDDDPGRSDTAVDAGTPEAGTPETGAPDAQADGVPETGAVAHTLFATEGETLVAFDVATGAARTGSIANVRGPTDLQATDDGHLLVNLTDNNEVLVVEAASLKEVARIKSSTLGASRPVHSFVTPKLGGKQYWVANNDGTSGYAPSNSVLFIDLVPGPTFLQAVGEVALGIGHHKNAFSPVKARVTISNIADCNTVLQVVDYADATKPTVIKKWSAAELDPARDCAMRGASPHGGAAAANGHGFHNFTGWGVIAAVDQDVDPPTVKLLPTKGSGAGYTKAGKGAGGRYVYSLQRTPREGDTAAPGADCQIGQLVVIDSEGDVIAAEVPILLTGPACTGKLPAHATGAGPDHIKITKDGKTLFVTTQAAPPMGSTAPAYSDQLVLFDLTDPAKPAQKPSLTVGKHSGHRAMALSGDDKVLFVVNGGDGTISQIDVATGAVTRTIMTKGAPRQVATYGSVEGPSAQTGPR